MSLCTAIKEGQSVLTTKETPMSLTGFQSAMSDILRVLKLNVLLFRCLSFSERVDNRGGDS